jgi:CRISPR-associated endonuclease/helicase Cas3
MLFSCLIDADYRDTEAFYHSVEARAPTENGQLWPWFDGLIALFDAHMARMPVGPLSQLRADVLETLVSASCFPRLRGHSPRGSVD